MRHCSSHLSHIEKRLMESEYLGPEVVRRVMQLIDGFSPPPRGDWGWLLRSAMDISMRTMRQLSRIYGANESREEFHMRGISLMRLYMEEAFHRCLLSTHSDLRKAALSSMMVAMRIFEADNKS